MFPTIAPSRPWAAGLLAGLGSLACGGGGGGSPAAPVQARFEADVLVGPAPLRVSFRDLSSGAPTSWSWDFGDGSGSTEQNPQHEYAADGRYDVALSVRAPGATDALARAGLIEVGPPVRTALEYGMNPSFARWSSREIVFADAMLRASEFVIVRAGEMSQDPAPLLPLGRVPPRLGEGWPDLSLLGPGEGVGAWLFGGLEGTLPDGRTSPWILTWEGTGSCRLAGTAVVGESRRAPRRVDVRVDPFIGNGNGTVVLWIESSLRGDPVRNVHVWLPGMSATQPLFWQPYVDLKPAP